MIDFAKITVRAGDGGRGAGSFAHIKGKRLGKANGGDGGVGGNVYFCATLDLNTLEPFRYNKDFVAASGANGGPNRRKGAGGVDLVLKVPVGTVVNLANTSNKTYETYTSYDLTATNQKVLVAKGGEGGRGNAHLRDEFGRRPKAGESGQEGEYCELTLELKLIADVGLIGLPNAGKSTLLAALTAATPTIADYPFTTLEPNLGVLEVGRNVGKWDSRNIKPTDLPSYNPKNLILADIPGLIEGASEGKGLGHLFLRHIERTRVLVHLIDISSPDPIDAYKTVRGELKKHSPDLLNKREIVVLNKVDLIDAKTLDFSSARFKKMRKKVIPISAKTGEGLGTLITEIVKLVKLSG